MPRTRRARISDQALKVIRNLFLQMRFNAQVFTHIEDQLEAHRIFAEAHENRRPRYRIFFGEFDFGIGKHLLHRSAIKRAVTHVPRRVQYRKNGFFAIAHHCREIHALAVHLHERAALLRRPGAFF